jgi:hypothetical protein
MCLPIAAAPLAYRGVAGVWPRSDSAPSDMEEDFDEATMDAGLIAAGQRTEHYEIAAYGTLVAWARGMGHADTPAAPVKKR